MEEKELSILKVTKEKDLFEKEKKSTNYKHSLKKEKKIVIFLMRQKNSRLKIEFGNLQKPVVNN